jgi:hypothetical protein
MSRFTERHLDPTSRLGEILFGFIMVLTATLTASFSVAEGKKGFVSFCSLRLVPTPPRGLSMRACIS